MIERVTCERCGRAVPVRHMAQHQAACDNMPTPAECCELYAADDIDSIYDLARELGCSQAWLRDRMMLCPDAYYAVADEKRRRANVKIGIANKRRTKTHDELAHDDYMMAPHCKNVRCGIRLDIPEALGNHDGYCGVCAGKERGHLRPLTLQEAYERAVYMRQVEMV